MVSGLIILENDANDRQRRITMASGVVVVVGFFGLMFMAFSLIGFETKTK